MPTFGEVLKSAREAAKLTQHQVAAKAGLSQAAISKAELAANADDAGRRETLDKIASAVGTTIETLLREMAPASPKTSPDDSPLAFIDSDFGGPAADAGAQGAGSTAEPPGDPVSARLQAARKARRERGYWHTGGYDNARVLEYLGDVIGRNFDHRRHKISDSHNVITLFEDFLAHSNTFIKLPNHLSHDIDLGVQALLDAAANMRLSRVPFHMPNLLLSMIISSGTLTRIAIDVPEGVRMPEVVKEPDPDDIPF